MNNSQRKAVAAVAIVGLVALVSYVCWTNDTTAVAKESPRSAIVLPKAAAPEATVREKVELPIAAKGRYWLTFCYTSKWTTDEESIRLRRLFLSPELIHLRNQCGVNRYNLDGPDAKRDWVAAIGRRTPAVVLQTPEGKVIYKVSRGNIPHTVAEVLDGIRRGLRKNKSGSLFKLASHDPNDEMGRRWWRRDLPCPATPAPVAPLVPVEPVPDFFAPIPDTTETVSEAEEEGGSSSALPLVFIVAGLAGAITFVTEWKKRTAI